MKLQADNIPLAPRRYPFFYGWLIIPLGVTGFLMSTPGQTYGISPFTDALIDAMGISRESLSLAYMLGTIGSALCLTFAGKAYDRFGARVIVPLTSLALGLILVMLSQCDRLLALAMGGLGLPDSVVLRIGTLAILFFLLRFMGQGVLTMASRNMMMKWFDRHRGMVTGISGMVIAPVFSSTPAVLNALVESTGWRGAWLWMALVIGGVFSVIAALFYRDNPEACGLKPDGPLGERPSKRKHVSDNERRQFTLSDARRTYSFWIFGLSLGIFGLHMTAMGFHAADFFETAGIERQQGYLVFFYAALFSVGLRPMVGWLCDRIPLKYLLMVLVTGIGISSFALGRLAPGWPFWMVVIGNGVTGSTFGSISSVTWPNFFGRKHLGAISGFSLSIIVFSSAVGPWFYSLVLRRFGSYTPATLLVVAAAIVLWLLAWRADNPQGER